MWAVGHARLTTNARLAILLHIAVSLLPLLPSLLAGLLCRAGVAAFALSIAMLLLFAWAAVFCFSRPPPCFLLHGSVFLYAILRRQPSVMFQCDALPYIVVLVVNATYKWYGEHNPLLSSGFV